MQLPSKQRNDLKLVDPELARWYEALFEELGGACRFDGARSVEESRTNIASGKSRLKDPYNSKHVIGPKRKLAEAIDIYPTTKGLDLNDPKTYDVIRAAAKKASAKTGVAVFNGAERWNGFDNPHWQLESAK